MGKYVKSNPNGVIVSNLPETEEYLRMKIAQKKTHIHNEWKRVRILEGLLDEVLKKGKRR